MLRVSKADIVRVSSLSQQKWRANAWNVSFKVADLQYQPDWQN